MAIKQARNVDEYHVIRRRGVYHSVGKNARAFSTWQTWNGSSNILPSTALS